MKQQLLQAVAASIEALQQVPGTQLQTISATLRQLKADLENSNLPILADLDDLIEDAAVAHFEDMAYMNGVAWGDEPELQPYDDIEGLTYEELYYEKYGCYPDEPKAQKAMSRMLQDMFPEDEELPW